MPNEYLTNKRVKADLLKAEIDKLDPTNCLGGVDVNIMARKIELSLLCEMVNLLCDISEKLDE